MITLEELTREVEEIAPLPAAAAKLVSIASDEDADVNDAVTLIRFDQALTASILRYANSPMAGSRYKVHRVKDAVVRLGLGRILEIAIAAHVQGAMRRPLPQYGLIEEDLWRHAVASALTADILLRDRAPNIPGLAFTAALLHDIGKLVLAHHLDVTIQETIQKLTGESSLTHYRAESEVLGFTHASVGARVALRWDLGDEIAQAIEAHHETGDDLGPVTDTVRVSNLVAKTIGAGLGFEGLNLAADAGVCERLGISQEQFEGMCAEVVLLLGDIEQLNSAAA
ncbi:HDOD domain-containing protein [Candidatus Eisenbacteria bacterium]|uniref:HDOD domain-containing protein n=1 Tax=Eiseniibacteriota bacterium TaxID=2212470 RepID=A0ABV6YI12_UNCEI